jgi:hypothetical protein
VGRSTDRLIAPQVVFQGAWPTYLRLDDSPEFVGRAGGIKMPSSPASRPPVLLRARQACLGPCVADVPFQGTGCQCLRVAHPPAPLLCNKATKKDYPSKKDFNNLLSVLCALIYCSVKSGDGVNHTRAR